MCTINLSIWFPWQFWTENGPKWRQEMNNSINSSSLDECLNENSKQSIQYFFALPCKPPKDLYIIYTSIYNYTVMLKIVIVFFVFVLKKMIKAQNPYHSFYFHTCKSIWNTVFYSKAKHEKKKNVCCYFT